MTKLGRERHRKVISELKRRKLSGESNLIIHNGAIVSRRTHSTDIMQTESTVYSTATTSKGPSGQSNQSS